MSTTENTTIEFTRISNDVNGNPRYVCHFLDLLTDVDTDKIKEDFSASLSQNPFLLTGFRYEAALWKAKKIGGKKYNTKSYGGGIVFQSYNIEQTKKDVLELQKLIY